MATWTPTAAQDLMAFAANHDMTAQVGPFQAMINAWADGLHARTIQNFHFGRYRAEVVGDNHQVIKMTFDL